MGFWGSRLYDGKVLCLIYSGKEICDNMCVSVVCISSKVLSLYYIDYTFGLAS